VAVVEVGLGKLGRKPARRIIPTVTNVIK